MYFLNLIMELTGKIIKTLTPQTGEGKNGPWKKQEYVMEVPGQFPKKVCFEVWGDKIDQLGIKDNQELTVSIEVESREYKERWYTNVRAWRVSSAENNVPASTNTAEPVNELKGVDTGDSDDALPF